MTGTQVVGSKALYAKPGWVAVAALPGPEDRVLVGKPRMLRIILVRCFEFMLGVPDSNGGDCDPDHCPAHRVCLVLPRQPFVLGLQSD